MTGEYPEVKTKRLFLRKPAPGDLDAYRRVLSLAEVTRYTDIPDNPTEKRCVRMISWMSRLHEKQNGCGWLIVNQSNCKVIGAIRINQIIKKPKCGIIGYELHPDEWGQGKMTEALRAVVSLGHGCFELNRLEAWTSPGNVASDRVLQKAGFQHEGTLRQKEYFKQQFQDLRIFARLASDPQPAGS